MANRFWCWLGVHQYRNWEEIVGAELNRTSYYTRVSRVVGYVHVYKATCECCGKMVSKTIEVSNP